MPFSSGASRWWVAAYLAVTLVCTTGWLILSQRLEEQTGLRRQVWPANDFQGAPVINDVAREPTLDFLNDDPDLPRRFFSTRWTGYWYAPEAGDVELHGAGDDRLDVWLDGELVIRRTPPADMHTLVRTVRLDAGVHELRVEYEQHGGGFNMRLEWAQPGGRARPLPAYRLFREWPDTDDVRLAYGVAWLQRTVAPLWIAIILAWLGTLAWQRVGPHSPYGRHWERAFRVAIEGPFGLSASEETGSSLEESDPATPAQTAISSPVAKDREPGSPSPFCSDCCSWATWESSAGARSPSTAGSPATR